MRMGIAGSCSQLCRSSVRSKSVSAAALQPTSSWLQTVTERQAQMRRRTIHMAAARQEPHKLPRPGKFTYTADKEGSPFSELGLRDIQDGMGKVRIRQHVNPLESRFQQPTAAPDWNSVYKDPQLPLFVDMGCGPGRFLLLLCKRHQQLRQPMNYLGLEIRQQLVVRANKWAQELDLDSQVHYLFTNVSISLAGLLREYPGPVATLSAQFPDPLFKKRHKKRRLVQHSVVQAARELLMPGGHIFLQSDIFDAVTAMRDEFEQHAGDVLKLSPLHTTAPVFHWTREQELAAQAAAVAAKQASTAEIQRVNSMQQQQQQKRQQAASVDQDPEGVMDIGYQSSQGSTRSDITDYSGVLASDTSESDTAESVDDCSSDGMFVSSWGGGGWLVDNPLGVPTEREHYVQAQGGKVFRVLLVKK